ncbi:hypothetical protein IC801_13135 [Geobacillus sp. 44B]|nr:hypothetical protein IC801_13135 [Geobacillus sp. 44B]
MKYSKKYCAFIDVLGVREVLKDWDKAMEFYNKLVMNIFPSTLTQVKNLRKNLGVTEAFDDIEWNIFSDSIIITSKSAPSLIFYVATLF